MAITEVDPASTAIARQLREDVTRGLQEPMVEVVHTLQRLAIAQVSPDSPQLDPHLLVRARSLAHSLSQVVEELVVNGTQQGTLDNREPQETLLVRSAIEHAAGAASACLKDRCVVVRGAQRVALTTITARFHALLVTVFELVDGEGELRILLERSRGELLLQFERSEIASAHLDTIRSLARAIGGTADRVKSLNGTNLVVWLPQQRATDLIEQ